MPYLTKAFSLKMTGERFRDAINSYLGDAKKLLIEKQELEQSFKGTYYEQNLINFNSKVTKLKNDYKAEIESIRDTAIEEIKRLMTQAKPEDIVQNDLMLLNDKLFTPDQAVFDRLTETYKDNFHMTNALCKYAKEHTDEITFIFPLTMEAATEKVTFAAYICRELTNGDLSESASMRIAVALEVPGGVIYEMIKPTVVEQPMEKEYRKYLQRYN